MTLQWFGDLDGVPADEAKVRATTAPVEVDAPPAEAESDPEFNAVETDPNPNLGGLATRQVASDWHETEKYSPGWAAQATAPHDAIVNEQVATSGTAASREMAGQFGHGTMSYAVGIEPTIRDGAAFGNDYFAADKRDIQENEGDAVRGVQPTQGQDRDDIAGVSAYGNAAARDATNNMAEWYAGMMGN